MAQIDDFFMYENRVEGITDADYQRAQPYVEAAQAFAQTTYQSIYIIDYYRKNFLYVSDNPLFLCGHTADEVRQMGYGFYLSHVPENEVPMLTELNRFTSCSPLTRMMRVGTIASIVVSAGPPSRQAG